jgi:hypothetical protein
LTGIVEGRQRVRLPGVLKDKARRVAVSLLTGPTGRFTAFVIDVSAASAVYWSRRLRGRETPW